MSSTSKLYNKHVLVFGGTKGIGRGVAMKAIHDGAIVTVVGSSQATADEAAKLIRITYPSAQISGVGLDLRQDQLEQALEALFQKIGQVHHVVITATNSLPRHVPIQKYTLADLQPLHERLEVMVLLAKVASRHLPPSRYSSLTFTSGSIAEQPQPACSVLAFLAQGTTGFIRGLALDMKPVRVNVVEPGYVLDTGLWAGIPVEQVMSLRDSLVSKNPTGSEGLVEDVAEAYLYLMKDGNCTGETIKSRSGQHLV
ncbi:hypothetical protein HG530_012561 [Fusarium avenaceum]|nr:hypothetical protein HG530_012561 [Fusarium avenaceum]